MLGHSRIDEPSTRPGSSDPLEHLRDQLQDLLLIHLEQSLLEKDPQSELPSLYLKGLRYVYGEKSVAKSSMRFALTIGTKEEEAADDVTLTLTLSVNNRSQ